jgi:NitT/TauT family transport system substrate-binding protein
MRQHLTRPTQLILFALVLSALILTGCNLNIGSRNVKDDIKLKVAIDTLSSSFLPDFVALDKGYSQAQGLTISPLAFQLEPTSPQMAEAIHSGAIDGPSAAC